MLQAYLCNPRNHRKIDGFLLILGGSEVSLQIYLKKDSETGVFL